MHQSGKRLGQSFPRSCLAVMTDQRSTAVVITTDREMGLFTLALPKSHSLSAWDSVLTSRFCGLMSRWQIPALWICKSDLRDQCFECEQHAFH